MAHDPTAEAGEWQLARLAAADDGDARARFWRHHAHAVRVWLRFRWARTPLAGFVDDAVQDVFVECFRPRGALSRLDPGRTPRGVAAFLRGVARNIAHRFERERAREHVHRRQFAAERAIPAPDAAGADAGDSAATHEQVVQALDRLDREDPDRDTGSSLRTFLREHFEQGLPVRAIAAAHHEPAERVHERRRRACRRFHACLLRVLLGPPSAPTLN